MIEHNGVSKCSEGNSRDDTGEQVPQRENPNNKTGTKSSSQAMASYRKNTDDFQLPEKSMQEPSTGDDRPTSDHYTCHQ
jgi:hypothetical protein